MPGDVVVSCPLISPPGKLALCTLTYIKPLNKSTSCGAVKVTLAVKAPDVPPVLVTVNNTPAFAPTAAGP